MPICGSSLGCSSGNRNESQMISGKKKIHKNQNEHVCASEADHASEFTTAAVKVNKTTSALHKHRAIQSGASRQSLRRFVEEAFNDFRITGRCECLNAKSRYHSILDITPNLESL